MAFPFDRREFLERTALLGAVAASAATMRVTHAAETPAKTKGASANISFSELPYSTVLELYFRSWHCVYPFGGIHPR